MSSLYGCSCWVQFCFCCVRNFMEVLNFVFDGVFVSLVFMVRMVVEGVILKRFFIIFIFIRGVRVFCYEGSVLFGIVGIYFGNGIFDGVGDGYGGVVGVVKVNGEGLGEIGGGGVGDLIVMLVCF